MTSIEEAFRYAFLGAGSVNGLQLLYSSGFVGVGITVFNRVKRRLWTQFEDRKLETEDRRRKLVLCPRSPVLSPLSPALYRSAFRKAESLIKS
jgi:hypothetical protein